MGRLENAWRSSFTRRSGLRSLAAFLAGEPLVEHEPARMIGIAMQFVGEAARLFASRSHQGEQLVGQFVFLARRRIDVHVQNDGLVVHIYPGFL